MSVPKYFEIGGIVLPFAANLEINQSYEPIYGTADRPIRMMDGTGVKQFAWGSKLRTTISVRGWLPPAFDGLDYTQPMLIKCAGPRKLESVSNAIGLPTTRRTDAGFEPHGYAIVNGQHVESPVNVAGDIATVTVVTGASHYVVAYYPEFTAWVSPAQTQSDMSRMNFEWRLEAEEV